MKSFVLAHPEARRRAIECVQDAPAGYEVIVKQPTRSLSANARLHSLLTEIAETQTWAGKPWTTEEWKRLLTSAWMRANNQQVELVPALDGHGFEVLYRRTSTLTKAECGELMDFIEAWVASLGVIKA